MRHRPLERDRHRPGNPFGKVNLQMWKRASFATLLVSAALVVEGQDFDKVQITVTKVAGNVYLLKGEGGNIAASIGEDGIVLVDDQYAPLAGKIQAALKAITDKPIRFVINTHYHIDHTGANVLPATSTGHRPR